MTQPNPSKSKLIIDVMGGDHAPYANLEGIQEALPELDRRQTELVLVGDEKAIQPFLEKSRFKILAQALKDGESRKGCRLRFIHAPDNIDMEDSIRAIRSKPKASINVGCQLAGEDYAEGLASAFISAGHSGAVMASAFLHMGRLKGAERPAIAVKLPTLSEDGCVVLDVGANVDCKPEHLRDFSIMGAFFGQVERKRPGLPRVGVLSNGEERTKGNDQVRAARDLIEQLEVFKPGPKAAGEFIGYVEGKEIFKGQVDVVVTDGFVGNVVLKSVEGLGSAVVTMVKTYAKKSFLAPLGLILSAGVFRSLKKKLDYAEYGAAPLLGVAGYAFICHGRSNARAIKNALLRARTALENRVVERLAEALVAASESQKAAGLTTQEENPGTQAAEGKR